jgi:probable HAF family extracellular repeat protein
MRDLGALNGTESFVLAMSPQAHIAGVINLESGEQRAMSWTAAGGMVDLGTFGGPGARAQQVNNKGQVVGSAQDKALNLRAFLWSARQGLADLNPRLVNAPAGLVLDDAVAISDNGAIVATSNAGLVLLRPVGQEAVAAPVVGPISAPALVRAGSAATLSVSFNDINTREFHRASLQWGDATAETALVSEKGGSGSVSASHVYSEPGVYTIIATVTDAAGNATKVKRELVVEAASLRAAGSGRLLLPHGANRLSPEQAGPASFSFVAPGAQAAAGKFSFSTARLNFRSTAMSAAAATKSSGQQLSRQLTGTGKLNGKDGYRYALTVSAGAANAASQGRFGLRIWHSDPATRADVVDFDNQQAKAAARATAVVEGAIAVAP